MIARLLAAPILLAVAALAAPDFTVNSPEISQCKPATFEIGGNWGANTHLTVLPSVDPCEHDSLVEVPITITNGRFVWDSATVAAGTSVVVLIDDDAGHEAWSKPIVVGGSAADCPTASSARSPSPAGSTTSRRPTSTSGGNTPANAAANVSDDAPSSAVPSIKGSFGAVVVGFMSAIAFLA